MSRKRRGSAGYGEGGQRRRCLPPCHLFCFNCDIRACGWGAFRTHTNLVTSLTRSFALTVTALRFKYEWGVSRVALYFAIRFPLLVSFTAFLSVPLSHTLCPLGGIRFVITGKMIDRHDGGRWIFLRYIFVRAYACPYAAHEGASTGTRKQRRKKA